MPKAAPLARLATAHWRRMSHALPSNPPWNSAPASRPSSIPAWWPLSVPSINTHKPLWRDSLRIPQACLGPSTPPPSLRRSPTILPRTTTPLPNKTNLTFVKGPPSEAVRHFQFASTHYVASHLHNLQAHNTAYPACPEPRRGLRSAAPHVRTPSLFNWYSIHFTGNITLEICIRFV